jgi:hypothetical protein
MDRFAGDDRVAAELLLAEFDDLSGHVDLVLLAARAFRPRLLRPHAQSTLSSSTAKDVKAPAPTTTIGPGFFV